ncbi:E1-E2 ATPase-domain-containing protein [Elsinoe ampelina]|uniref:E1-E2 ATPase-domain-containing protein n=1 Tax=Elsinoe ampelina TaxID=302913 RepID=A0A6A6GCX7_9PEZI|nr:E1-E2 ATPase-domain-containing protein [Elsinoe ampelina]
MVVKEDGTKWACQSCLKGHRVSGCTHTDRPLQFVPKKGRPVTQCQHCRVERKKRSAHVKCDCGEKSHAAKEKCVHLRDSDAQDSVKKELGPVPESDESDEHTCCCHHGEKCTCSSIKKDSKDEHHAPHSAKGKPNLTTTRSEGHLTVFANGHHKPCHRNNHSAHDANAPYRVHKPHPHPAHGLHAAGRRSVDSLSSVEKSSKFSINQIQQMATTSQPVTQPQTTSNFTAEPQSYAAFTIPADNSTAADDFFGSVPSSSGFQQPQMSADLTNDMGWAGLDWSAFTANDKAQPALTYASSNTISELGEHTPPDEFGTMFGSGNNIPSNLGEAPAQLTRIPEAQPSFEPQVQRLPDNSQNRWSLPPSFWADNNNFVNLGQQSNVGSSAMDISKVDQNGGTKDFAFNDWANSYVPPTTSVQSFDMKNSTTWSPDLTNQQSFDFGSMPGSADVNMNNFDFVEFSDHHKVDPPISSTTIDVRFDDLSPTRVFYTELVIQTFRFISTAMSARATGTTHDHRRTTFLISNLHCPSCISSIDLALAQLSPRPALVSHSIINHTLTIEHRLPLDMISQILVDNGYEIDSLASDEDGILRSFSECETIASKSDTQMDQTARLRHQANCKQCQLEMHNMGDDRSLAESPLVVVDSLDTTELVQATISIDGMTCASCVGHVDRTLKEKPWINSVDINLLSGSAKVVLHGRHHLDELISAIEDVGFDAAIQESQSIRHGLPREGATCSGGDDGSTRRKVDIHILGIYCQHCPPKIQPVLEPFVTEFGLTIERMPTVESPILRITYIAQPPVFTLRRILAAITSADPNFSATIVRPTSIEERARIMHAREQRNLLRRLILSGIAVIPTFIIGIVFMNLVDENQPGRMYLMEKLVGVSRAEWALFILATPVYFFAADMFHRRSIKELRVLWQPRSQVPIWKRFVRFGSMNTLISFGTSIAYFSSIAELSVAASHSKDQNAEVTTYSYFDSAVFLTFFLLIGRLIEAYSKTKAGDAVAALGKLRPDEAVLVTDSENGTTVNVDLLDVGDLVRVTHGGSPPCDGIVTTGTSTFNESSLTGESRPVSKAIDDPVYSGTVNTGSPVTIKITGAAGTSMLDQIIGAVRDGQTKRAPVERVVDSLTAYFVPAVTLVAITTWIVWLSLGLSGMLPESYRDNPTGGWPFWSLQFAIAVFVIACPCGIGLAAPTALFVGGGLAAKHGILVKGGGEAFQEASRLDCVVFDKTGTLTMGGEPRVVDFELIPGVVEESLLLSAILAIESSTTHPIAKALVTLCRDRAAEPISLQEVEEIPGHGMRGITTSSPPLEVLIGNESLLTTHSIPLSPSHRSLLTTWSTAAKSLVLIAVRHPSHPYSLAALASTSDPLRPEAPSVISALHALNITTYLLTGDNPLTAHAVAASLSIPPANVIAAVLPTQKAAHIRALQRSLAPAGRRAVIAMVGDGVNDAPSLAAADVGIAIGSGSDVAISAAHFVLLRSDLGALLTLVRLSRKVFDRVRWNFGWALVYNLCALPVAAGVLFPVVLGGSHVRLDPAWAAAAMAGSSRQNEGKQIVRPHDNSSHRSIDMSAKAGKTGLFASCSRALSPSPTRSMTMYTIAPVTYADAPGLAEAMMSAMNQDHHYGLLRANGTTDELIAESTLRLPHNLRENRSSLRHQKVVHTITGEIVGYARWELPEQYRSDDIWAETQLPAATEAQQEGFKRDLDGTQPGGARKLFNYDMANYLGPRLGKPYNELVKKGDPYLVLDYMVCHPAHQRKGIASMLLESGEVEARKLGLKLFVMTSTDPAGKIFYESSGFRNLQTVTLDDSKWGGKTPHVTSYLEKEV